jgi:hypothetical protein
VLFHLTVSKTWLRQVIVALTLNVPQPLSRRR